MSKTFTYVLKLQNYKWYIGVSKNVEKRFQQHKSGQGAAWTKLYKTLEIRETTQGDIEQTRTITYMKKYGIDNVRGGSFANPILEDYQVRSIYDQIRNEEGVCLACGLPGHFAKNCKYVVPEAVQPPAPQAPQVPKLFCTRCKRNSHTIYNCFAKTSVNGERLRESSSSSDTESNTSYDYTAQEDQDFESFKNLMISAKKFFG